jgi:MFS family permease
MIGFPWYLALILILAPIVFFGVIAFALLPGSRLPSEERQVGSLDASDQPSTSIDRDSRLGERIFIASWIGIVWLFVWMMVHGVLDHLYRGKIVFNPADPWPLVRLSFLISVAALFFAVLMARIVIWMRKPKR